jgi:hypothetical protein
MPATWAPPGYRVWNSIEMKLENDFEVDGALIIPSAAIQ